MFMALNFYIKLTGGGYCYVFVYGKLKIFIINEIIIISMEININSPLEGIPPAFILIVGILIVVFLFILLYIWIKKAFEKKPSKVILYKSDKKEIGKFVYSKTPTTEIIKHPIDTIKEVINLAKTKEELAVLDKNKREVNVPLSDFLKLASAYKFKYEINKEQPKNESDYRFRGLMNSLLGKDDEALEDYTKLIELNPKDAHAYNNRAFSYRALKRFDEALDDFKKAIELEPNNGIIHYNIGCLYLIMKEKETGIDSLKKAVEINPEVIANIRNDDELKVYRDEQWFKDLIALK
jgi:tetratricopeptide (TPR) repeat protein